MSVLPVFSAGGLHCRGLGDPVPLARQRRSGCPCEQAHAKRRGTGQIRHESETESDRNGILSWVHEHPAPIPCPVRRLQGAALGQWPSCLVSGCALNHICLAQPVSKTASALIWPDQKHGRTSRRLRPVLVAWLAILQARS